VTGRLPLHLWIVKFFGEERRQMKDKGEEKMNRNFGRARTVLSLSSLLYISSI
jgi:hypothetical protein